MYNDEDLDAIEESAERAHSHNQSLHSLLPILSYTTSTEESIALNKVVSGAIIIAGSGMCNGGRIRHHLKQNLWRKQSHVVFVGFQAMGTPGRKIIDGATHMKMAGENIIVRAQIHTLGGFSAHASQEQLIGWLSHFTKPPKVYLVHGEDGAKQELQSAIKNKGGNASIPQLNDIVSF